MNIKKALLLALPLLGVAVGGLTALSSKNVSLAEAADYSTSAKGFKLNNDNSVSATFTVSNSDLNMRGWLLCLLTEKPDYDINTRKLNNSDGLHPFGNTNCEHYFFASCSESEGKMSITWAADAADQKDENLWKEDGNSDPTENLAKYMGDANDYHIVIGPRHFENSWGTSEDIGEGKDYIWENCDYYVGSKTSLLNGVEGQTYLDLSKYTGWEDAGAKFGFYYFDDTVNPKKEAWSDGFAQASDFAHIYLAQYNLDFVPKGMIAVRFNNNADTLRWNTYDTEDYVWGQSTDEEFFEYAVSGVSYENEAIQYWSYEMAGIKFGEDNIVALDHLKRNDSEHSENFNQYVSLSDGDTFVISFDSSTYNTYSVYDTLKDNFTVTDGQIEVLETGIYALYFDTDAKSLYITTVLMAKLDEWCQSFLGSGCDDTIENWNSNKTYFQDNLYHFDGALDYLLGVAHVDHDVVVEGYIALAMQRYDFLVANFKGYDDYIGRCESQNFSAYSSGAIALPTKGGNIAIILVASSITLVAFISLLIVRKKRAK